MANMSFWLYLYRYLIERKSGIDPYWSLDNEEDSTIVWSLSVHDTPLPADIAWVFRGPGLAAVG